MQSSLVWIELDGLTVICNGGSIIAVAGELAGHYLVHLCTLRSSQGERQHGFRGQIGIQLIGRK